MESYAALWCKSNYSFLEGASHPEELVEAAHGQGVAALALSDRDGVYGVVKAFARARDLGQRLIVGAQLSVAPEGALETAAEAAYSGLLSEEVPGAARVVLLCQDAEGYAGLCTLITQGRMRSPKGRCAVSWEALLEASPGLLALWPGWEGGQPTGARGEGLAGLREAFGDRVWALLARHQRPGDLRAEAQLRAEAAALEVSTVAGAEVLYHDPARRGLQDVLACARRRVPLSEAGRWLRPNDSFGLPSPAAFRRRYADDLAAVDRSLEIAARCTFSLGALRYRYPDERLPSGLSSAAWLRSLCAEGARWRYGGRVPAEVEAQLERELTLIEALEYPGYFLTMWEIVEFCRSRDILCQGRGSAANSAVCYCLGITAVDPVRMGLLFERFLSVERREPPDIDLDIEHARREEVIQWVYEKYGRAHAAMVANVIRFRRRSAIREVGVALGLPETSVDRLSRLSRRHEGGWEGLLTEAGLDPARPQHQQLSALVDALCDFPRHLSIHPGGFLLGQAPVHHLVPIEGAAMEGRTVIQWDKDDVETLGLFKVDLLALGGLTLIHRCLDLITEQGGPAYTLATLPPEDPAVYEMCCRGDTVGVFQIESRAQMSMLPRLRPRRFYDLVIQISIVRPGPIAGDMVHPFLRRRNGEEPVLYPHPSLEPVLKKTLGVPLFQEQVMKLAMVAADYSPGEADQLRRDMAAWRRSGRIESHRERLTSRMTAKGIEPAFADRIFEQIRGFAEYGFPESHAASFALIAYATAWLRCHHPAAFTCAILDAQPMGFYSPATLVEDARRRGVEVRPIDVRASAWGCTLEAAGEGGWAVRMGLRWVKGLREALGQALIEARSEAPFESAEDLLRRVGGDEGQLRALAEAGALEGLGLQRREALWELPKLLRQRRTPLPLKDREAEVAFPPLSAAEEIAWDYRAAQHSPRGHPVGPLRPLLRAKGWRPAAEVATLPGGRRLDYVGLVITRQRPGTAGGVLFLTLEDETGFVNVIVWRDVYERHSVIARTAALLGVSGRLQRESGALHLIADRLWEPPLEVAPAGPSRDFR